MSDPLSIAKQAEENLNSYGAKQGVRHHASESTRESGVDANVEKDFPGAQVKWGSAASGAGDNREIPVDEGGDLISLPGEKGSGHPTKARDFEGPGGPETKRELYERENPAADDVESNVRQKKAPR